MEPGKLKKNILNFATLLHRIREWELNFFPYHSFTLTIIAYPAQVHLSKMLKKIFLNTEFIIYYVTTIQVEVVNTYINLWKYIQPTYTK